MTPPAEIAARYATYGWPVLPLHTPRPGGCTCATRGCGSAGKHPRTRRGHHDATVDLDLIAAWWRRWPDANVGIATGAPSGLVVVDVDLPDGPATLDQLQRHHGRLPDTCQQTTGSGGRQLLFTHPGGRIPNRTRIRPGIDVRGDGGYIVVPPSRHPTGHPYRWTGHLPPAPPPPWLLRLLDRTHPTPQPPAPAPAVPLPAGTRGRRYAAAALADELDQLASAVEGTRNNRLNRAAFALGQLVGAGLLDADHVTDQLHRVAADLGLPASEIRRTVTSGLTAGAARRPRTPPVRGLPPPVEMAPPTRARVRSR